MEKTMSDEIRDDGSSALSQTAKALLRPPYHTLAIAAVAVMGGAVVGAMASGYGASGFGASSSLRLDESALRTIASEVLNDATISHIQCGVGPDLCEVLAGDSLLYMDRSGRYGIAGSILDFQTRTDLTAAREQDLRRFVAVAAGRNFADAADVAAAARPAAAEAPSAPAPSVQAQEVNVTLPIENAVVYNGDQGLAVLNIFSDLNCSFCNRLHQEIDALGQYEIHEYFIEWLGPSSREKAVMVLCADDRASAATQMYASGEAAITRPLAECAADYDAIIAENTAFAHSFGLQGTPAMFFEDGRAIGRGYATAAQIQQEISIG
tara:strand:- start:10714 stop:11682 length:969 start_codon:yes stop_codon:yes gene_type:complete